MKIINLTKLTLIIVILCTGEVSAQSWTSFTTSNSSIPFNKMNSMDIDINGKVWVATDVSGASNHLAGNDGSTWTFAFPTYWVNALCADPFGNVWASTGGEI